MNLRLAAGLGFVALARPVLSIAGAYGSGPAGPVLMTALIAVVWVGAAVLRQPANPIGTLAAAGVAYTVFAVLLNWSLQPFLASAETIPLPGYPAMLIFNTAQGAVLGVIAWLIRRARRRRADAAG